MGVQAMNARQFSVCLIVLGISVFALACGGRGSVRSGSAKPSLDPLRGSYVFFANGSDPRKGDYFVAGSLTADGRGNLTGVEDLKRGSVVDSAVELEGTYQLDSSGTVHATLTDGSETAATMTFTIPSGATKASFLYDGTGTGTVQRQTTTGFSNVGKFDFKLSGQGEEGEASASGSFTTAATGEISAGSEEFEDGIFSRTTDALTGQLGTQLGRGRGIAIIGLHKFSYYVVSPNQIILAGLDRSTSLSGTATTAQ